MWKKTKDKAMVNVLPKIPPKLQWPSLQCHAKFSARHPLLTYTMRPQIRAGVEEFFFKLVLLGPRTELVALDDSNLCTWITALTQ